jgi:hypothetical protein
MGVSDLCFLIKTLIQDDIKKYLPAIFYDILFKLGTDAKFMYIYWL